MIVQAGPRVLIVPCRRGDFAVNRHDNIMTYALATYGEFAEDEFDVLGKHVKPGMVVIDVGANIGVHTVAFSKMLQGSGLVLSFEPLPTTYNLLAANLEINGINNVFAQRAAVGATVASLQLPHVDPDTQANFGTFNAIKEAKPMGVPTPQTTIDAMGVERCDLIKIDVEGSEMDVLRGASKTIAKYSPVVFAECNEGEDAQAKDMLEYFAMHEYTTYWHKNRFARPDNHNHCTALKDGHDRNMLAIKSSADQSIAEGLTKCLP